MHTVLQNHHIAKLDIGYMLSLSSVQLKYKTHIDIWVLIITENVVKFAKFYSTFNRA